MYAQSLSPETYRIHGLRWGTFAEKCDGETFCKDPSRLVLHVDMRHARARQRCRPWKIPDGSHDFVLLCVGASLVYILTSCGYGVSDFTCTQTLTGLRRYSVRMADSAKKHAFFRVARSLLIRLCTHSTPESALDNSTLEHTHMPNHHNFEMCLMRHIWASDHLRSVAMLRTQSRVCASSILVCVCASPMAGR